MLVSILMSCSVASQSKSASLLDTPSTIAYIQALLDAVLAVLHCNSSGAALKAHLHLLRGILDLLARAPLQAPLAVLMPALSALAGGLQPAFARQALAALLRAFASAAPSKGAAVLDLLPALLAKASAAAAGPSGTRLFCACVRLTLPLRAAGRSGVSVAPQVRWRASARSARAPLASRSTPARWSPSSAAAAGTARWPRRSSRR